MRKVPIQLLNDFDLWCTISWHTKRMLPNNKRSTLAICFNPYHQISRIEIKQAKTYSTTGELQHGVQSKNVLDMLLLMYLCQKIA